MSVNASLEKILLTAWISGEAGFEDDSVPERFETFDQTMGRANRVNNERMKRSYKRYLHYILRSRHRSIPHVHFVMIPNPTREGRHKISGQELNSQLE